jgi:dihydroorotate dehydrogenase electron transfer subunit
MSKQNRGSILVEDALVLAIEEYPDQQFIIRLQAPRITTLAGAGSFVHIRCGNELPMRRPMSIMRVNQEAGCFDILFKIVGAGTRRLSEQAVGTRLSTMGPIGRRFTPVPNRDLALLIGGGVGIPPMLYLAESLHAAGTPPALVAMGSEVPFPFADVASEQPVAAVEIANARAVPELEAQHIPSRLATTKGYPGCFDGYVTELARAWLQGSSDSTRARVAVYACGPNVMLKATAALSAEFDLPCQVSLEEFMACAVGGCAGCTVLTNEGSGPTMRRVCVDGPVFDAGIINWEQISH